MVFQNFNLFPHKSVMENLTLAPVLVQKMDLEQALANAPLQKVGLEDKLIIIPLNYRRTAARWLSPGSGHEPGYTLF